MGLHINKIDDRFYVVGDTYDIKDHIKSLGGQWDRIRRGWWFRNEQDAKTVLDRFGGYESSGRGYRDSAREDEVEYRKLDGVCPHCGERVPRNMPEFPCPECGRYPEER